MRVEAYKNNNLDEWEGEYNNLYVKGFPVGTTENELIDEFGKYGLVKKVFVKPGKDFGFVQFSDYKEAEKCMIESRKNTFRGYKLTIELYEKSKQRKHVKSGKSGASGDQ